MNSIKRLLALMLVLGTWVFMPAVPAQATVCPTVGTTSTPFNLAADGTNTMDESSGVSVSGTYTNTNTIWDHEDSPTSGNGNFVYAHNGNNGNLRATVTLNGVVNHDWEDISIKRNVGTDVILVSDTGDNAHSRTNDALLAFNEPDPGSGNVSVTPTVYPLTFKDSGGATVKPNVEAMAIDQNTASPHVFFFAKENSGGGRLDFSVYDTVAYSSLSTVSNNVSFVASISGVSAAQWTAGTRTGPVAADISSDRSYLILKNYAEGLVWPLNGAGWSATFAANPDAPCVVATTSGKYEGVAFSSTVDELYQVRDDVGNGNSPLKEQTFTP